MGCHPTAATACESARFRQRYRVFKRFLPWASALASLLLLASGLPARAVILFGSGDPARNTQPPTGALAGSGWQWQADAGTCATAVGPHHALTAHHLGLRAGSLLSFGGLVYPVIAASTAPDSDFTLVELAGSLPSFAPLNLDTNELGRSLVIFGRGTRRGNPVLAPDGSGEVRGWLWAGGDGQLRWGTNVVADTDTGTPDNGFSGAVLVGTFGPDAGGDTATLSTGDSGGGTFVLGTDGQWRLAGVNYAVEATFNTTTNGAGFSAALFNRTGFYEQDTNSVWVLDEQQAEHPETVLLVTRVSSYAAWAQGVMGQPLTVRPVLLSAPAVAGPYAEHPAYAVDATKHQITLPIPAGDRFFQLQGATNLSLPTRGAGQFVFGYQ